METPDTPPGSVLREEEEAAGEEGGEASASEAEVGPAEDSVPSVEEEAGDEGEVSEAGAGADHSFSGNFNKHFCSSLSVQHVMRSEHYYMAC